MTHGPHPRWPERPVLDDPPAPVVTEEGEFGPVPEPVLEEERGALRSVALWAAATVFAVATAGWLVIVSIGQMTSTGVAVPALERVVDALTESRALLQVHAEDIAAEGESRGGDPSARVEVPGFPVQGATLTADEAAAGTVEEQHRALLRRSAELVYTQGSDVFQAPETEEQGTRVFSTSGGIELFMDSLSESNHDRARLLFWPLAGVAAVAGLFVLALGRGFGRFIAVGVAAAAAGVLVLVFALGLRVLAAFVLGGDSALSREVSSTAATLAAAPLRNAVWALALGLALALPALLLSWLFASSVRREGEER